MFPCHAQKSIDCTHHTLFWLTTTRKHDKIEGKTIGNCRLKSKNERKLILGNIIKQMVKIYTHLERILLDIITLGGYYALGERSMIAPIGKAFA